MEKGGRLRFYVLALVREFREDDKRLPEWEMISGILTGPPAVGERDVLVDDADLPPGVTRRDVGAAFEGISLKADALKKFSTRTLRDLRRRGVWR